MLLQNREWQKGRKVSVGKENRMSNDCEGCEWYRYPTLLDNSLKNKPIPIVIMDFCEGVNVDGVIRKGEPMSDLISRKAVLKHIEKIRQGAQMTDDIRRASIIMNGMDLCEEAVRNQPSAQPDHRVSFAQGQEDDLVKDSGGLVKDLVNDCISRQAAIDAVLRAEALVRAYGYRYAVDAVRELPAVQPVRLKGQWTDNNACPFCGFQPWYERDIHTLSYCPNCCADMRKDGD